VGFYNGIVSIINVGVFIEKFLLLVRQQSWEFTGAQVPKCICSALSAVASIVPQRFQYTPSRAGNQQSFVIQAKTQAPRADTSSLQKTTRDAKEDVGN
jgi:hypothetical protein